MKSIWQETCKLAPREQLRRDLKTEVAVIGGGMAGVLIASALREAGLQVTILEADRIGSGQTGGTSAKITSQHGLIYARLTEQLGEERSRLYAQANEAAIREYRRLVSQRSIQCDLEERSAFLYGSCAPLLRQEAEAACHLGLPAAFVDRVPIPAAADGAVRLDGQAQFHPLKFLRAMASDLEIFENTPVLSAHGRLLQTPGGRVEAEHIVFACHFPFVNFPGMYFARMHQERSYVLALENAMDPDGMFLGIDDGFSFRSFGHLLLLGGGGHRTGENSQGGSYELLRRMARIWFPRSREVACWSAQDCMTPDGVPYIGRFALGTDNWYVATGFRKWGMTTSMVAAMVLRDLVCGRENPWAQVFDPGRTEAEAVPALAAQGVQAVKGLARRFFQIPKETAAQLPPGHGGVVTLDGQKAGVYKDENGKLYGVDIRCPHLGCQLEWNPDERSWDCPCHGSRFDPQGHLISGPAQKDLEVLPIQEDPSAQR